MKGPMTINQVSACGCPKIRFIDRSHEQPFGPDLPVRADSEKRYGGDSDTLRNPPDRGIRGDRG